MYSWIQTIIGGDWNPDIRNSSDLHAVETLLDYPDYRVWLTVDADDFSDNVRTSGEPAFPEVVAENRDRDPVDLIIGFRNKSAAIGLDSQNGEEITRYILAKDAFVVSIGSHTHWLNNVSKHAGKRRGMRFQIHKNRIRKIGLGFL